MPTEIVFPQARGYSCSNYLWLIRSQTANPDELKVAPMGFYNAWSTFICKTKQSKSLRHILLSWPNPAPFGLFIIQSPRIFNHMGQAKQCLLSKMTGRCLPEHSMHATRPPCSSMARKRAWLTECHFSRVEHGGQMHHQHRSPTLALQAQSSNLTLSWTARSLYPCCIQHASCLRDTKARR